MNNIAFRSASDHLADLRAGRVGARELVDLYLDRIERHNPALNAVVALDAAAARRRADEADAARARGEDWGALHGLPITLKDSFEAVGFTATSGAKELRDHRPAADAPAVARLRAAGAIVLGKTNLPLYGGDLQTYNDVYGTTNNPWNLERIPGGSSGGAAAALAAGMTGLELGSDIGGSIRNPAHFCGVYGHKPSFDLVPMRGHIPGPPGAHTVPDICVAGPLARSAEDLDLALALLAGPDTDLFGPGLAAFGGPLPAPRATRLGDFRIAAWLDDPVCPIDDAVRERLEACTVALERAGARVDRKARPDFDAAEARETVLLLLYAALGAGFPARARERFAAALAEAAPDDASARTLMMRGIALPHRVWLSLNERRARLRAAWARFFRDYDVLLCPVFATAALPHDHSPDPFARTLTINGRTALQYEQMFWALLSGAAYLPATVAPVGRTAEGLPVGVQIVAPFGEDRTSIALAQAMAGVAGGFEAPPGYD